MKSDKSFVEVCIYEVKTDKTAEFEELVERVTEHHRNFPGVIDVRYIKRTHRPGSFSDAKAGKPSIHLRKKPKFYTYILCWELDNEITHGKATGSGLENFFKEFNRCLPKAPKIILGERIH